MARIHTYEDDQVVRGGDKWIGSDAQSLNKTKNFTADKVAEYYALNGVMLSPNAVTLQYKEWQNPSGTPSGFFWSFTPINDTANVNSISSFGMSKKDLKVRFFDELLNSFQGHFVFFYNTSNPNNFSIYKLVGVENHPDNANLFKIDVQFIDGNGFFNFEDSFFFGLLDRSVNYSDIEGSPTNLSEFTNDVGFITADDLPNTAIAATQFSSEHTSSLGNGYLAGDVVYYQGRIYRAKFNNDAIIPTPGGNTYWDDLGEGYKLRQINADWNSTSGDSLILNKPEIPTKTSDLDNDGEDGISPFVSQIAIQDFPDRDSFPTIGQNGVIYIAEDTDLAYTWDSNNMDYALTTMPDTGITGIGKTNRIAKFNSPTNLVWSKISEDQFGSVKIADSNRPFLTGNSVLSVQRPQNQLDFVMGNSNINQPVEIISDNTGGGLEIKSKGILSLKAGASYLEGIKVLTDGKLQITQAPDAGATSDLVLVRDSSGNVKTISYPSLTGFVPYTGATQDVDLGEYELKAGQIELDQSPTGTAGVAVTRWNNNIGSTETTLKGGNVILKNGVDLVARVVNKVTPNTTLTKAAYQVVRISGAQGQRLAVQLAQANNDNNSADTLGVVIETIPTNQEGFIMTVGQLEDINTTGSLQGETWADGDVLYLSPTIPGAITKVKPTGATGHIVVIGYVEYAHANHGKIYVKIMNGWELDELHNVYINSPTNNQVLAYTSSTQLWENKTLIQDSITDGVTTIAPSQNAVFDALATKQDTLTNPITGTGANGQVAFFNGATTQLGDNGLFWDNTNKRLGIGTTSPQSRLNVFGTDELLRFGDGTSGNDAFMSFNARGFVGFRGTGGLNFIANTSRPIIFGIGNTFSSFTECARFSAVNGNFLINTATDSGFRLSVNGTTLLNGNTSIGGGTAGARLDVRAQGALSTDIAFRVRNSADTANLISVDGIGQTIITPSALTGSAATNALDIAQTWNTSGTPTLIRANVTDTASNANSLLMDLRVSGVSRFSMTKSGRISFGAFGSTPSIFADNNGILFTNFVVANQNGYSFGNGQGQIFSTFGINNGVRVNAAGGVGFVPTSGTAIYNSLLISEIINQTGGANGITRGLFINPTLTSAADWRSIENTIGNNLLNSTSGNTYIGLPTNTGTAKLQVRGGGTTSSTTSLRIENSASTASLIVNDAGTINIGVAPVTVTNSNDILVRNSSNGNIEVRTVSSVTSNSIQKSVGSTYTTNSILAVTQAEYNALTPDPTTLYFII